LRGQGFEGVVAFDVVGFSFTFRQLGEEGDFFGGLFEGGVAVLLELAQHFHVLVDAALDALRVEAEKLEVLAEFLATNGTTRLP